MPLFVKPPSPGRPPKTPVDRLQARVWFHAVATVSGLDAAQLEQLLEPEHVKTDETGRSVLTRKWARYRDGAQRPDDGEGGALARAEARFPGTGHWYTFPLWRALRPAAMSEEQTHAALLELSAVRAILFKQELPTDEGGGTHRLRLNVAEDAIAKLVENGSLDAFAAALLLARRAEAIASMELRDIAADVYARLQPRLATDAVWAPLHPELFDLADERFKWWALVDPANRLDIMIVWRGWRQQVWPPSAAAQSIALEKATGRRPYAETVPPGQAPLPDRE